jgi:hypothetical protein
MVFAILGLAFLGFPLCFVGTGAKDVSAALYWWW